MEDNKEKILYENTTLYTKELYLEFTKFHVRKKSFMTAMPLYICMSIMLLSSILLIALNLDIKAGIIFLILSLVIIITYIFLPNISVNRILKFDKTFEGTENKYSFFENSIEANNKFGDTKVAYNDLYKLYETNSNFYLYINPKQAFLINKAGFGDKVGEATEFLKNKFNERYIKK